MALKKSILILPLLLISFAIALSCVRDFDVPPLTASAAPTPTFTPAFTSCTPVPMLTPSPWPNTMVATLLPPAYSGNAVITLQIFDSTYTQQLSYVYSFTPFTTLTVRNENQYGVTFTPGNYYLEVTEEVIGSGTTCYFQPITIN